MSTTEHKALAAIATLEHLGYTYLGGEQWKPPLGKALDFMSVDYWRGQTEILRSQADADNLRHLNHTRMIKGYQDKLAGLRAQVEALTKDLADEKETADWHKRRTSLLQLIQRSMQEPERTMVCDVLANGHLLQGPDGKPDKQRYANPQPSLTRPAVPDSVWIRQFLGKGGSLVKALYNDPKDEIDASATGDWIQTASQLLTSAASHQPRPAVPDADLVERCREIVIWRKTGILPGGALRQFAEAECAQFGDDSIQQAEIKTIKKALEWLAAAPQPEAQPTDHHANCPEPVDEIEAAEREHMGCAHCKTGIYAEAQPTEATIKESLAVPKLPAGWVPCTITFDNSYPEEVAYGPKVMMDRLAKWLEKHFARGIEDAKSKAQPTEDQIQAAFETWLYEKRRHGDVESVQRQWEASSDYAELFGLAQPTEAAQPTQYLQKSDQQLLRRFIETSDDDQPFDIGVPAVKRLADLGVVRNCGFGKYAVTMFGYWVHEHFWHQNPPLPLMTNADRDAVQKAKLVAQKGGA